MQTALETHVSPTAQSLQFVLLPGAALTNDHRSFREAAYTLWRQIAAETYTSLSDNGEIPSDQFTRQEMIGGLFDGDLCVGIVCFRSVDVSSAIDRADSWFKFWPDDVLRGLGQTHRRGMVMSYFMVHPEYRRTTNNTEQPRPSVAKLLIELANTVFFNSSSQIAFGMTRNNRSVNKLVTNAGWTSVLQGVNCLGYDADLVILRKDAANMLTERFDPIVPALWEQRIQLAPNRSFLNTR